MRILQINHQYPPFSCQGSELHCWQLSQSLSKTDDVAVFHISVPDRQRPHRLDRSSPDGFPVFHCIDGGQYARQADWPNPFLRRQFQTVLETWRPEVVHFHNYLSMGDDLPSMAKAHGAAVAYTLHDFGLICPNHLLLRTDGAICGKCQGDFFQDCCPAPLRTAGGRTPWLRHRIPSLERWQFFTSQQASPLRRWLLQAGLLLPRLLLGEPATSQVARKRDFFLRQTRRIFEQVDLFVCPSVFLMDKFVSCGLPAEKALHIRYGIRRFQPRPRSASSDGKLRFGFIGSFHAHKGLSVLVRAFEGLADRASLRIHGSSFGSPVTESHWRRIQQQAPPGIEFHGAYRNDQLEEILSTLDVVVVPSLWYENSPFTIQEAFQAGLPVITSNAGGMSELVRDGIEGLQFQIGNAADLRRAMRSLLDDPGQLERFRQNLPDLPTLEGQAALVRRQYEALLGNRWHNTIGDTTSGP
jgi:glycosyltransferase involved in cell wall biosynthesis